MFGFWIILLPLFFYSIYSLGLIRIINYIIWHNFPLNWELILLLDSDSDDVWLDLAG